MTSARSHHDNHSTGRARLHVAWERGDAPFSGPIAVEFAFEAPNVEQHHVRRLPLNVGLAIDRSGSMAGPKLAAARQSAAGVLDALADGERFAATAFDSDVLDITPSVPLDGAARQRIRAHLNTIESGGCTALFDGFRRAAELVASGGDSRESDSWVIVLSDGMGNHGLVDPPSLRHHAAALAERGIRTITIGIGDDYQADQLTALATGGNGEFHHASRPGEIVEIVAGELASLRAIAARDLAIHVDVANAGRLKVLGGESADRPGGGRESRFSRVGSGRSVRLVTLVWPRRGSPATGAAATFSWTDVSEHRQEGRAHASRPVSGPRDLSLALRAARLWQAHIIARALELNERGQYERAEHYVSRAVGELGSYAVGLAEREELLAPLSAIAARVGRQWGTLGHKEAYVMARHAVLSRADHRPGSPMSFMEALEVDDA
jgi:Ca-activated chloride channel family protein